MKIKTPYHKIIKTITSDNETEFVRHQQASKALNAKWFFANPYCSQQEGVMKTKMD